MDNVRPAGRDVRELRQVRVKDTGAIIWADSDTFNEDWHEEIQGVARDPKVAAEQEAALKS